MKRFLMLGICIFLFTGCLSNNNFEGGTIYTTIYPLEFIVNNLYSDHANVLSTYPDGVIVQLENCDTCDNYTLTNKQLEDYSNSDLFIFNSLLYEGQYVKTMLESNRDLKIINATDNLELSDYYGYEEMWLDPFRLLTISRNIKIGFVEYIDNYYLQQEIEQNFEILKEELDKLGAKMGNVTKSSSTGIMITDTDTFKFFEKGNYGLTVYSLEENENLTEKILNTVQTLIDNGTVKYIFTTKFSELNDTVLNLIEGKDIEIIELHTLTNLSENERSEKKDYFSIMNENIELLKKGLN